MLLWMRNSRLKEWRRHKVSLRNTFLVGVFYVLTSHGDLPFLGFSFYRCFCSVSSDFTASVKMILIFSLLITCSMFDIYFAQYFVRSQTLYNLHINLKLMQFLACPCKKWFCMYNVGIFWSSGRETVLLWGCSKWAGPKFSSFNYLSSIYIQSAFNSLLIHGKWLCHA